jgi:hypothetical protein
VPAELTSDFAAGVASGEQMTAHASAQFRAHRRSDGGEPWARPELDTLTRQAADARPNALDPRASYVAVANGLTLQELLFMVGAYGEGQPPPRGNLIRAAGFMRANPESCDALEARFATSRPKGRELIVDLLASSGDAKAQAVMRAVLATPAAREDATLYQHMLQRFALVTHPNAESVAFVLAEWGRGKASHENGLRQASVYTLGSLAFHANASENADMASSILARLLGDLRTAHDANEERGLVAALGNTGMEGARAAVMERTTSRDAHFRAQAAISLRKFDEPAVRLRLVAMVGDDDLEVAQAALRSLDTQHPLPAELAVLAERAENGTTNASADPALVTFVAAHRKERAQATRILEAIAGRVGDRRELKQQVDAALATLAAEGQPR